MPSGFMEGLVFAKNQRKKQGAVEFGGSNPLNTTAATRRFLILGGISLRCMMKLKAGDYVRVINTVHDDSMPHCGDCRRDGLVVEVVGDKHDQAVVMFHNKAFLKFHVSQLTKLSNVKPRGIV